MNRRHFLRRGATIAGGALLSSPLVRIGHAAGASRALVCVFLYGGNDTINMLPPTSLKLRSTYDSVRGELAIAQAEVRPLGGSDFGLHPRLADLQPIWDAGRMALVHNVGPLSRPLSRSEFVQLRDSGDVSRVPEKLFSHNDQQTQWQNALGDSLSVRGGWGGRLMEALGGKVISFGGNSRYASGVSTNEIILPGPGADLSLYGSEQGWRRAGFDALRALASGNVLRDQYAAVQRSSLDLLDQYSPIIRQAPKGQQADAANAELSVAFKNLTGDRRSTIANQLYQVAKFIKSQSGGPQVYFVSLGGFDHHEGLLAKQDALFGQLGPALASFWEAMGAIGRQNDVTVFTGSDFGRTFKPNSSGGTDHAWGSTQLVFGGAVKRGDYGQSPNFELGGANDASANPWEEQGRWIPTTSVTQYASVLVNWLAGGSVDVHRVLPQLDRFPNPSNLAFL